jgi:hypothetical protein
LILYVETHWILSCVQAEEGEALDLLHPRPPHGALRVYLPAFCIAEAITRIRTKEQEAKQLRAQLEARRRAVQAIRHGEARRFLDAFEDAVRKQDELIGVLSSEFNAFIEYIFASEVELIPETYAAIKLANSYMRDLKMARGDSIVLATVIDHVGGQDDPRKAFVSGDQKAFGRDTPATAELTGAEIKSFSSIKNALGWLNAE